MHKYTLLISLITLSVLSCKKPHPIEGNYVAVGYNCYEKNNLIEKVKVVKNEDTFYAIKTQGDDCIKTGDTTWYGKIEEGRIYGFIYGINHYTGKVEKRNCQVHIQKNKLDVLMENEVVIQMAK